MSNQSVRTTARSFGRWNPWRVAAVVALLLSGIAAACQPSGPASVPSPDGGTTLAYEGKKVLAVNSYHEGYEWSDGIEAGLVSIFDGTGVELKLFRMDTKNNPSEEYCMQAGQRANAEIAAFAPDVIITADDNAQKCLTVPYLKDQDIPVVFCGINWDASMYGFSSSKVTGMIEVELPSQLVDHLSNYAQGKRLVYLTVDSETERKVADIYNQRFFNNQMQVSWVTTLDEYKAEFIRLQQDADILFLGNNAGCDRWDEQEMEAFVAANIRIPTGSINSWMVPYSLITLAKRAEEQGEWAARAALRILDGTPVSEIPQETNKDGQAILNLDLADRLGVVFSPALLKNAQTYRGEGE